jgi:hypothetical protein
MDRAPNEVLLTAAAAPGCRHPWYLQRAVLVGERAFMVCECGREQEIVRGTPESSVWANRRSHAIALDLQRKPVRQFLIVEGEGEGGEFTLESMLDANRDDQEICDWVRYALVGDVLRGGGGAGGEFEIRRVA